ncbi:MAG: transglycosylase SLT domain-containing protein [Arcobacteraceae bacterium]|nr:transglycosylase SLT domain-containing protein [Arcobacteraceae bacterium]
MPTSNLIKKLFFVLILSITLFGTEFKDYLKAHNDEFTKYQKDIDNDFATYKKAYDEAFKEYKSEITKKWPTPDISTNFKWVEYDRNYNSKKAVDFQKQKIDLEVIANDRKEAEMKLTKMFEDLTTYDVNKGYLNDILEQKISRKLGMGREPLQSKEQLISDMISKENEQTIKDGITADKLKEVKYKDKLIYKIEIPFPPNALLVKAKLYKGKVQEEAKKQNLDEALIYAIIENESSFNPLAKSYVPAFGLMQIVPQTAGVDSYYALYGQKKLLDSEYLFEPNNNILIGATYLNLLYYKYLKNIKDPQNRLYCTIASYNGGSGTVANSFSGAKTISQASNEINSLSSDDLYKKMMKDISSSETRKYLFKVRKSFNEYSARLKKGAF